MNRRTVLSAAAAAATLPLAPRPGLAQAPAAPWPSRSLRMVIPWPPGQSTDVQGRLMAQWLGERLGQTVVPENRPGAGGQIGTNTVAKAAPDGYSLLAASIGPISFQPLVTRTPYDVERELAPVASYGQNCFMVLVRPDFPAADLRAFVELLRANPGKYTHNSSGVGGAQHMVTALFNAKAGIEALHVPFQGSGPALAALLGGQVHYGFDTPAAAWRLVQDGQLRALGHHHGAAFAAGARRAAHRRRGRAAGLRRRRLERADGARRHAAADHRPVGDRGEGGAGDAVAAPAIRGGRRRDRAAGAGGIPGAAPPALEHLRAGDPSARHPRGVATAAPLEGVRGARWRRPV